jgi:hypothetical protein
MSRGRSRHHVSRRRIYSARQRDLRERRRAIEHEQYWLSDTVAAVEISEELDFETPASWTAPVRDSSSAA